MQLQPAISQQCRGTTWQNNSCAYNAVITILFNVWQQNPANYTAAWQQMGSHELSLLVVGFRQLIGNPQLSLETIRDTVRQRFATLSDTHFRFGQYTSAHNLLLTLLTTQFAITRTTQQCINPAHATLNESITTNAVVKVSTPPYSLQAIVNHFQEVLASRCPSCNEQQIRQTWIVSHSPLIAFEWGIDAPILNKTLNIVVGPTPHEYYLCGVIYLCHEHFTSHFIDQDSQWWFHDSITTAATLQREPPATTQHPHAVLAIYRY